MPESTQLTHAFEAHCKTASEKNLCWKLFCTTCGNLPFREGLYAISRGSHPGEPEWESLCKSWVSRSGRVFTPEEQRDLCLNLADVDLSRISSSCKFPDWLGYLGLVLYFTSSDEWRHCTLTKAWLPQLLEMMAEDPPRAKHLGGILESERKEVLVWRDLEVVESALKHSQPDHIL